MNTESSLQMQSQALAYTRLRKVLYQHGHCQWVVVILGDELILVITDSCSMRCYIECHVTTVQLLVPIERSCRVHYNYLADIRMG